MIEVKQGVSKRGTKEWCNCCQSDKNVKKISFVNDNGSCKTSVLLCEECQKELIVCLGNENQKDSIPIEWLENQQKSLKEHIKMHPDLPDALREFCQFRIDVISYLIVQWRGDFL